MVVSLIIPNIEDVMTMVEKNIFRPLPNFQRSNLAFSETGVEQEEEVDISDQRGRRNEESSEY